VRLAYRSQYATGTALLGRRRSKAEGLGENPSRKRSRKRWMSKGGVGREEERCRSRLSKPVEVEGRGRR
jgi:hypothetical protein